MRSVWQSLAWKEWHEHKWKLAALMGVLCGATAIALIALIKEHIDTLDGLLLALIMCMIPLTLFIAAGEAAGESAGHTMPFLQALPVPMWQAAAWKLVLGAVTCLLPVLLTLLMIAGWYYCSVWWGRNPEEPLWYGEHGLREATRLENPLLAWCVIALALVGGATMSLLIWATALGANRKSDVGAGATALLGIVGCWVSLFVLLNLFDPAFSPDSSRKLIHLIVAASPCGLPLLMAEGHRHWELFLWWAAPVAAVTHGGLVVWYLRRFGHGPNASAFSPSPAAARSTQLEWLGRPRRSPLSAIVWKQFRESGPIVLAGLAAILAFVVGIIVASAANEAPVSSDELARVILALTADIGFLTTLIVGIGVFDRDLSPKLHTFWRSRPIDPNLWYWTKYLTGLMVLAVALLLPVAVASVLSWAESSRGALPFRWEYLADAACVYWGVYAFAASAICLVRMAIYAAILSTGALAAGLGFLWFFLNTSDPQWTPADWMRIVALTSLTTAVLAALVGWWVVRRDVGWRKG